MRRQSIKIKGESLPILTQLDRHTYKMNNYAYIKSYVKKYQANVEAFEIGARAYITKENKDRLKTIYSFCKKDVKLKQFVENIARLAMLGSYSIYLCRDQTEWTAPALLTV